jgi:hypothetical protein
VADTAVINPAYEFLRTSTAAKRLSGSLPTHTRGRGHHRGLRLDVPSIPPVCCGGRGTLTSIQQVEQLFGPEIASLVDGVTVSQILREEKQAETCKMILAMARDIP